MTKDLETSAHSVYALNYHLIQCVKYRQKVLCSKSIIEELKERTRNLASLYDIEIVSQETDMDHIHILFKAKPNTELTKFINNWKSATAKVLRNKFSEELKNQLWGDSFWSDSYCLITTGQTSLETVRKYIEDQGKNDNLQV